MVKIGRVRFKIVQISSPAYCSESFKQGIQKKKTNGDKTEEELPPTPIILQT